MQGLSKLFLCVRTQFSDSRTKKTRKTQLLQNARNVRITSLTYASSAKRSSFWEKTSAWWSVHLIYLLTPQLENAFRIHAILVMPITKSDGGAWHALLSARNAQDLMGPSALNASLGSGRRLTGVSKNTRLSSPGAHCIPTALLGRLKKKPKTLPPWPMLTPFSAPTTLPTSWHWVSSSSLPASHLPRRMSLKWTSWLRESPGTKPKSRRIIYLNWRLFEQRPRQHPGDSLFRH